MEAARLKDLHIMQGYFSDLFKDQTKPCSIDIFKRFINLPSINELKSLENIKGYYYFKKLNSFSHRDGMSIMALHNLPDKICLVANGRVVEKFNSINGSVRFKLPLLLGSLLYNEFEVFDENNNPLNIEVEFAEITDYYDYISDKNFLFQLKDGGNKYCYYRGSLVGEFERNSIF